MATPCLYVENPTLHLHHELWAAEYEFDGHDVHSNMTNPSPETRFEYCPAWQASQLENPLPPKPVLQMHELGSGLSGGALAFNAQKEHALAPEIEYASLQHLLHVEFEKAPIESEYLPAAQSTHVAFAIAGNQLALGHNIPAMELWNVPFEQEMHLVSLPTSLYLPILHLMHPGASRRYTLDFLNAASAHIELRGDQDMPNRLSEPVSVLFNTTLSSPVDILRYCTLLPWSSAIISANPSGENATPDG